MGKVDSVSLGKKVNNLICKVNKNIKIINWYQNISIDEVKKYYHDSDCFIFASSCENMPNILIEAMSSGLPIVCSNLGPMKEFLKDSGIYFNPIYNKELKNALIKTINDKELRTELSTKSYKLSFNYDWEKCAKETISFILKNKKIL